MKSLTPAAAAKALTLFVQSATKNPRADPRSLKPAQLLALANSTPLRTVLTAAKLRKHRKAAAKKIGDGNTIDIVRYTAWLAINHDRDQTPTASPQNPTAPPQTTTNADAYARKKIAERERQATKSRDGRELGELPPIADPDRRERCRQSLREFLETYFATDFPIPWSDDHRTLIDEAERIIKTGDTGGLKAIAMPRGTGKTTICERAALYAVLYGYHAYLVLIGANKDAALENLESLKYELEANEMLTEDFPEVCIPIQEIGGIVQKCAGQTYRGQRTRMTWKGPLVILPTIAGSLSSGAIIQASGLLGRVRGMKQKTERGTVRPTLALIDDPQTDASARSATQITKRLRVMTGAVLGLAGPGRNIAAMSPVTVICVGDMADQILDRDAHPEWNGLRTKMLYGEAVNKDLLDVYWDLRAEEMRSGDETLPKTNAWYLANQKKIEAGFRASWPERKSENDVSAIQHAINLIQDRGKDIFDAEYQNDPQPETAGDDWHIPAIDIAANVSGLARGIAPLWTEKITAFCDVQQRLLYFAVVAWGDKNRGSVIDYGTWPEQKSREFLYKDIRHTLARKYPKRGVKGSIKAGLADLADHILHRDWKKEDNTLARVTMMGIDSGNWTADVHEFIRTSKMAGLLVPCKGKGITADKNPISEWRKKPNEKIGEEWILTPQPKHASRLLTYDTNYWKRELFIRLSTPAGDPGHLSLFGSETVLTHRMIAAHFHGETFSKTEGGGRDVYVFAEKPGRPDNHLFDCAVGSMVCTMPGLKTHKKRRPKPRPTYFGN